jgi:hypothetical protein
MRIRIIQDLISLLFIILFVYAAFGKLADFDKFQIQLGQSPLLTPYVDLVSWTIPFIEIWIAFLLVSDKTRLLGMVSAFSLMVLFTFYILAITHYSYFIPCSCGGVLQHMSWDQHLVFNLIFVFLGIMGILIDDTSMNFIAIKSGETENLK